MIPWFQLLLILFVPMPGAAAENWEEVLARMPLKAPIALLHRTNCVEVMLTAFQSNGVIKALIFLPGATDEFYMFRRAQAHLTSASPALLDAVIALTNQTRIKVTFKAPFLLLHTSTDPVEAKIVFRDPRATEKLLQTRSISRVSFNDNDWDFVQPKLKKWLKADVKPWHYSTDSFHFYRCALAGWNLSGSELLEVVALASQTRVAVNSHTFLGIRSTSIRFDLDTGTGQLEAQ